jgi:hypothetical protein
MHTAILAAAVVAVVGGLAAAGDAMPDPASQDQSNALRTSLSCAASQASGYPAATQARTRCVALYSPYLDVMYPVSNPR